MNSTEIERLIIEAIKEVAPEVEKNTIDFDEDIREECDLDSMDFINYLAALQKSTGIKIIEGDYPKFHSINSALAFLNDKNS
ncbi:acyl carrier protein [Colwellia sp. MB02u-18]|uniref:acyl carrier protein n=1 Tax=unclassified Colwellia TaxID=196834 RepID=UPI0015F68D47|nr:MULTISPECIES: acyl carrier protein [unclassified Colwellia]MBA6223893.1 acyl carrier protein [Colwellia sp. MB3u-45]MBA6267400.1 acyl carrier protein [Colwellia sp. MB3u-43]MBA6320074.1 acyl carrier protein [Colwellia sp. MB02u-19]MBA6324856.1 acyl carrier protein [Colwellia sp. MB02u-18]MBA6330537.1 acyl carrier protein [Colwellia sp. MB02u-12]